MITDEPLLSPARLWYAVMLWAWLLARGSRVPLARMLRYHRRPFAAALSEK